MTGFKDKPKKDGTKGYGWASPFTRWCTKLKQTCVRDLIKELVPKGEPVVQYVGFAADEAHRAERKTNKAQNFQYPLIEWGITEAQALQYCYSKGFDWGGGLYEHFSRVSCFCCPLKGLKEVKQIYRYYPEQWAEMKRMDNGARNKFRMDYSLAQLEERFQREIELESRLPKLIGD